MPTFERRTLIRAPVERVFGFHMQPDALERLMPPEAGIRVLERKGAPLAPGTRVVVEMKVLGPIRMKWVAEHTRLEPGKLFVDVQRKGPFARWKHLHLFEPAEHGTACVMTDRVEYALPLGRLGAVVGGRIVRRKLERMFEARHEALRELLEP